MTSSIFKKSNELKNNLKKLSLAKQQLLRNNFKTIQSPPLFPNNFPNMLRAAIKETKKVQNLDRLSQTDFFEKYETNYEEDIESNIAQNCSIYFSRNKRPQPSRMKRILKHLNEEGGHELSFSSDEVEALYSANIKLANNQSTLLTEFEKKCYLKIQKVLFYHRNLLLSIFIPTRFLPTIMIYLNI